MVRREGPKGSKAGSLIIIGGHEDKSTESVILDEVARQVRKGKLLVVTSASEVPDDVFADYDEAFGKRHVRVEHVNIRDRESALETDFAEVLDGAKGAFFTGGDQLKLTTRIEGTKLMEGIRAIHERGGVIAGTSAGASAMSETMLVSGAQDDSPRAGKSVRMAPGFGMFRDAIVDQHFAQRGRIGRLMAAVANNPRIIGIGIDEDTAIVVEGDHFRVIGAGGVYVVCGKDSTYANLSEREEGKVYSVFDMRIHLLSAGDTYDMADRTPHAGEPTEEDRKAMDRE